MPKNNRDSSYVYLLLGQFFALFLLVPFLRLRGDRGDETTLEGSHNAFQYRTAVISLWLSLIFTVPTILFLIFARSSASDAVSYRLIVAAGFKFTYFFYIWASIRNIRGLFLSGAQKTIVNPKTWWVWPRSVDDVRGKGVMNWT